MTCFFCKGSCEESTTNHMIDMGHCILILKHVPCRRCTQCGEITFSSDIIEQMDAMASRFENEMAEVAVVDYDLQSA